MSASKLALAAGFTRSAPGVGLDAKGYVQHPRSNLVAGVRLEDIEADFLQGDGNELLTKFRAAHSSSALAANCFGSSQIEAWQMPLPTGGHFTSRRFEAKCPHGLPGRRSPNLDVLFEDPEAVVGIESKCLETLSRHSAEFAPIYETGMSEQRRASPWFAEMKRLVASPDRYCWLDAAQLVKHAFGLGHSFTTKQVSLLYVFWEPANPKAAPIFDQHRAEVARFSEAVCGGFPTFIALSYPELWSWWEAGNQSEYLSAHIRSLRDRYLVEI